MTNKLNDAIAGLATPLDSENYVTAAEVESAIQRSGKEKASGADGLLDCVFHEIFKFNHEDKKRSKRLNSTTEQLNELLKNDYWPNYLLQARVVPL